MIENTDSQYIKYDSDLHCDMLELKERKESGTLNFLSHNEVWGEHISTKGEQKKTVYAMN